MFAQGWLVAILMAMGAFAAITSAAGDEPESADPTAERATRILAEVQGTSGHLEVLEVRGMRILACDGVIQSAIPSSGVRLSPSALVRGRDFAGLIPYYRPRTRDVLVIGLGAGLHAQAFAAHGVSV